MAAAYGASVLGAATSSNVTCGRTGRWASRPAYRSAAATLKTASPAWVPWPSGPAGMMSRASVAAAFSCCPARRQVSRVGQQGVNAGDQRSATPGAHPFRALAARGAGTAPVRVWLVKCLVPATVVAVAGGQAHLRRPPYPRPSGPCVFSAVCSAPCLGRCVFGAACLALRACRTVPGTGHDVGTVCRYGVGSPTVCHGSGDWPSPAGFLQAAVPACETIPDVTPVEGDSPFL